MGAMTIARRNSGAEACPDIGPDARRSDRPRLIKAARIAVGGPVPDRAPLDASRGGARLHRFARAALPETAAPRLRRHDADGWAVLALAGLHWAAVASLAVASIGAGVTLWLG